MVKLQASQAACSCFMLQKQNMPLSGQTKKVAAPSNYRDHHLTPSSSYQAVFLSASLQSSFSCPWSTWQDISPTDLRSELRSGCTLLEHSCEWAGLCDSFVLVSKSAGVEAGRAWKRIIHSLVLNYWTPSEHRCFMHKGARKHTATLEAVWKLRQNDLFPHRISLKTSTRCFNQASDSCACMVGFLLQFGFVDILL